MASVNAVTRLDIRFPAHEYPIYIGDHLLSNTDLLQQQVLAQQALVVTNETVAAFYLDQVKQALSVLQCDVVILPDGETHKNQESLFIIHDALIKYNHHRDTTLFALGGGVIGDIAGFAAATYQRGVRLVYLPTTLLAQVDSSVGGKTAINHAGVKNAVGSFYQPHAVLMDLATLSTLPSREFRAGFAEVIKYGLLVGGEFLQRLVDVDDYLATNSTELLTALIAQCCQIKANVVQTDERDQGQRAFLNLGHTFAHALEAETHYQRWLHGEAVAIGLYCAALLSHQLGHLSATELATVDLLLANAQLPRRIPKDIDLHQLYRRMWHDKKIKQNRFVFVLVKALGHCYLETAITERDITRVLSHAVEL